MARPMRNMRIIDLVRREVKAVLRLSPWLLISLLFAVALLSVDLAATSGLFQSPPLTETLPPPPTKTVPPPPAPTQTAMPIITPTVAPTITAAVPLTPGAVPTEMPPAATTVPITPPATLAPSATPGLSEPEATAEEKQRYATEDSNLKFDLGMLFDSVALAATRVWLCCGVLLFVLIPVFFIALWVASKRRQQGENQQRQE